MKVVEIGRKRDVRHKSLCETDSILLQEMQPDDVVVMMKFGSSFHCFLLAPIARWFFDSALTFDKMPLIPTTGETATRAVYREVVHAAMHRFRDFAAFVQSETYGLSEERRAFLEADGPPPPPPPEELSLIIPEHYSPTSRRRGRRDSFAHFLPQDTSRVTSRRGRGRRRQSRSPPRR